MPTPEEIRKTRKLDEEAIKLKATISEKGVNVIDRLSPKGSFNTLEREQDIKNTQSDMDKTPPPFIIDQETGKVTGITRNGKTFFLPPEEIEAIQKKEAKEQQITDNAISANEKARLQGQASERQTAAADVGLNLPTVDEPRDEPGIDTAFQVAGATGGGIAGAGTVLGAAGSLAKLGLTAPLPPQFKLGLAAVGLVTGGVWGVYKAISADQRDNVEKSVELFNGATKNMRALSNQADHDPNASPWNLQDQWDTELANLAVAERNLKKLTQDEVDRFTSGGETDYTTMKAFFRRVPLLTENFRASLLKPNPNAPILTDANQNG